MTIKELRCSKCNRKLLEYSDNAEIYGTIEIETMCPRCKEKNKLELDESM